MKITDHFRRIYRILHPKLRKENRRMSTCKPVGLANTWISTGYPAQNSPRSLVRVHPMETRSSGRQSWKANNFIFGSARGPPGSCDMIWCLPSDVQHALRKPWEPWEHWEYWEPWDHHGWEHGSILQGESALADMSLKSTTPSLLAPLLVPNLTLVFQTLARFYPDPAAMVTGSNYGDLFTTPLAFSE